MFGKKNTEPQPKLGDYRIVEVRFVDGYISYEIQRCDYNVYNRLAWLKHEGGFGNYEVALSTVKRLIGEREQSRRVVWP